MKHAAAGRHRGSTIEQATSAATAARLTDVKHGRRSPPPAPLTQRLKLLAGQARRVLLLRRLRRLPARLPLRPALLFGGEPHQHLHHHLRGGLRLLPCLGWGRCCRLLRRATRCRIAWLLLLLLLLLVSLLLVSLLRT